ncbi:hypothetical protein KPL74_10015 [Bacillus sp. NP157]|nr:hypothetical protein KPL74_10015 [Bacillus sp. NP157]
MNAAVGRRRIFIFYPAINERAWRVLTPGGTFETFPTEGRAVAFALETASRLRATGICDVLKETISGGWAPVHTPLS